VESTGILLATTSTTAGEAMKHDKFFERYGEYVVPARYYECRAEFTVEDLYQALRARWLDELLEIAHEADDDGLKAAVVRRQDQSTENP